MEAGTGKKCKQHKSDRQTGRAKLIVYTQGFNALKIIDSSSVLRALVLRNIAVEPA